MQKRLELKLEAQQDEDEVMSKILGFTEGIAMGKPKYKTEEFKERMAAQELADKK